MDIQEKVIFANTNSWKIYSYTFAKLILGFSPWMKYFYVK